MISKAAELWKDFKVLGEKWGAFLTAERQPSSGKKTTAGAALLSHDDTAAWI